MSGQSLDLNTLSWVKSEIDETLNQARISLEAYVENTDDESKLRFCINYLHQINGTLQMVELYGAGLAIEEMEALAKAILDNDVNNRDDAYEALMRGILQVPDYLEHLMAGHADMPVVLLPLLNDLRAARGEALLSESALFTPDLEVQAPIIEMPVEQAAEANQVSEVDEAEQVDQGVPGLARKLRHNYHLGLLGWFRDKDAENSLQRITNVLEQLYSASTNDEVRRLMWIASGLAESLKDGGLETSVSVKLLLGQVDRQIKKIIDQGETALDSEKPVELEKNLLFYVASSNATNERTEELKQAFNLKSVLPDSQTLEQTRADLSGPNAALLQTVSSVIMEDLNKVKETLDVFVRSDDRDLAVIQGLHGILTQMGDTLAMLGLGIQRQAVLKQAEILDSIASGETEATETSLMPVAAAMLSIESSLSEISTARAVNEEMQAVSTDGMDAGEVAIEQLQEAERRKLMQTVLNEAGNDINRIKDAISDYSRDTAKHELLDQVPESIERVRGSLLILSLDRAAGLLSTCNNYVQNVLLSEKQIPDQFSFNALADAISSVEYYIESLTGNWGQPDAILDVAEQSLKMLGADTTAAPGAVSEEEPEADSLAEAEPELEIASDTDSTVLTADLDSELSLDDFQLDDSSELSLQDDSSETELSLSLEDEQNDDITELSLDDITSDLNDVASALQESESEFELTLDDLATGDEDAELDTDGLSLELDSGDLGLDLDTNELTLDLGSGDEADEFTLNLDDELSSMESEDDFAEMQFDSDDEFADAAIKLETKPQTDITPEGLHEVVEFWFFDSTADSEYVPVLKDMLAQLEAFSSGYQNDAALQSINKLQSLVEGIEQGQVNLAQEAEQVYALRDEIISQLWPDSGIQATSSAASDSEQPVDEELSWNKEVPSSTEEQAPAVVDEPEQPVSSGLNWGKKEAPVSAEERVPAEQEPAPKQHVVDDAIDDEIIEIFLEEAQEAYESITDLLPKWQANQQDIESLKELRRAFHTLKGSGRLVGAVDVGEFAWAYENMLNRVIDDSIKVSDDLFNVLNAGAAALPELFELFRTHGKPGQSVLMWMEQADALSQGKPIKLAEAPVEESSSTRELGSVEAQQQEAQPAGIPIPQIDGILLEIYTKEVATHIETLNAYISEWKQGNHDATYPLLRALHTLTGSSRTTAVFNIAEVCSKFEDYVKALQKNEQPFIAVAIDLLLQTIDLIERTMQQLTVAEQGIMPEHQALLQEVAGLMKLVGEKQQQSFEPEPEVAVEPSLQAEPEVIASSPVVEPETVQVSPATPVMVEATEELTDVDEELLEIFLEEGTEILDECDQTLQDWSSQPDNAKLLEALQRHLHTLKGGARMAGISTIGDLGHSIESMLTSVVDGHMGVSKVMFELLQRSQDRLVKMLDQVQSRMMPPPANDLLAELESLAERGALDSSAGFETTTTAATAPPPAAPANEEVKPAVEPPVMSEEKSAAYPPSIEELKARAKIQAEADRESSHAEAGTPVAEESQQATPAKDEIDELPLDLPPLDNAPAQVAEKDNIVPLQKETQTAVEQAEQLPDTAEETDDEQRDRRRGPRIQHEQIRVRSDLLDNLVNFAGEVSIYRSRLEQQTNSFRFNLHELEDTVVRLRDQLKQFEIETEAQIQYRREETFGSTHEDFDPLEFDRFTTMQHLSRAMLESLSDLDSLRGILHNLTREQETLLLQQSRVNTELQEGLMRTRMVPFSGQAARLRRIVRQTSSELGKPAELHLFGVEEELDRSILDRVIPPVEHMLRNAIAHGIEKPGERKQAGKDETGQINMSIAREGSEIKITISDDGAGINLDAIFRKAVEKGMMKADDRPTKDQLIDLMMQSGFSTAEKVSQIAGRGVGMDVVNNEIKQLGGVLEIDTSKGKGTSFIISLPLTLAITRALMIEVGEETFAIPLLSVEGVERISHDELLKMTQHEKPVYSWLNQDYNFMHLGSIMGLSQLNITDESKKMPMLMVRTGDYRAAILVDGLLGSREIVVKPVGAQLSTLRGISGATIMGDGSVVLIVDLSVLMRLAASVDDLSEHVELAPIEARKQRPLVMVVDDSITVRKVTTRLLERNEMDVISAKDGVDALAQLQEQIPDVMLLDVEMPRMDGFELATNVRNTAETRHIPIIMITSRTGQKHRDRAASIGVNIYMGKPYTESDLMSNIYSLIGEDEG